MNSTENINTQFQSHCQNRIKNIETRINILIASIDEIIVGENNNSSNVEGLVNGKFRLENIKSLFDIILTIINDNLDLLKIDRVKIEIERELGFIERKLERFFVENNLIEINQITPNYLNVFNSEYTGVNFLLSFLQEIIKTEHLLDVLLNDRIESRIIETDSILNELNITSEKIKGVATEEIYKAAFTNYANKANGYDNKFYYTLGLTFLITIVSIGLYERGYISLYLFVYFKVLILSLAITLITFFLRKASTYRRMAHQAEQTHLELEAFPSYVSADMDKEDMSALKKELALRYFGKELESKPYEKMGDLLQEQMRTSMDMMKTARELMKTRKDGSSNDE